MIPGRPLPSVIYGCKIETKGDFIEALYLNGSDVDFAAGASDPSCFNLFVRVSFYSESMSNDFRLDAELVCQYRLNSDVLITPDEVYGCAETTRDYLERAVNNTLRRSDGGYNVQIGSVEEYQQVIDNVIALI